MGVEGRMKSVGVNDEEKRKEKKNMKEKRKK